jgi:hypothetical protein
MSHALPAVESGRRYRLSDERAGALLALLNTSADALGVEGHTEQTFQLIRTGMRPSSPQVTLRHTVGDEFAELRLCGSDGLTSSAQVYAAGPIEWILSGIGFREVSTSLVVARRYVFDGAEVRVAHATPQGWSCELRPPALKDLASIVAKLGSALPAEQSSNAPVARATAFSPDRRQTERRASERRALDVEFAYAQRRTPVERRLGDRRFLGWTQ